LEGVGNQKYVHLLVLQIARWCKMIFAARANAGEYISREEEYPMFRASLAGWLLLCSLAHGQTVTLRADRFLLGPSTVVDAKDATIRLAHSVLLSHEMGAADFRQNERLTDKVQAKKLFMLDDNDVTHAELFLFGNARQVEVNGTGIGPTTQLESTGWHRIDVPVSLLKRGDNQIIFRDGGGLLVDAVQSGRSFKSEDGGKTWSSDNLTTKGGQQGEYLVRLRLGRFAPQGWALSEVIDLWRQPDQVARPAKLVHLKGFADVERQQPAGTRLQAFVRTGSTPEPQAKTWTAWHSLSMDLQPPAEERNHRWAQVKFALHTTRAQLSPRVPAQISLSYTLDAEPVATDALKVVYADNASPTLARSPVPFVYQEPSPRLKLLRERYKLDDVIAPGKTELEKLMLLRHWVRNQWHTAWQGHPAQWMPPWDALIILESKDQPDCLTMCTHYACVYTQCCLALGWTARHCILDHHCVSEVWMNDFNKWVMMDPGNSASRPDANLHYELNDMPLSARELHLIARADRSKAVKVRFTPNMLIGKIAHMCRPAPKPLPARPDVITLDELDAYPVCHIVNFRRYGFPARNNFLDTLFPGELYQGWSSYYYDGYWWVGDSPEQPQISPEYSNHLDPVRQRDVDWPVNQTGIHLSRTARPGVLRVDLETTVANLARHEKATSAEAWKATPQSFLWELTPGSNVLVVRGVNAWDKSGRPAQVTVEWPGK